MAGAASMRMGLALVLALLLAHAGRVSAAAEAAPDCPALLKQYYAHAAQPTSTPAAFSDDNLLLHLIVPEADSTIFDMCLLQRGTPSARRCATTAAANAGECSLLSTFHDLSTLNELPAGTAAAALLRDPVERLLGSYEFSIELAVNLLSLPKDVEVPEGMSAGYGLWPFRYLQDHFAADMKPKVEAAKRPITAPSIWIEQTDKEGYIFYHNPLTKQSKWELTESEMKNVRPLMDPYDNDLVVPLKEFIKQPIATELLHNGQLLQILGISNSSTWEQAAGLRKCMQKDAAVAEELLQFGLKRLEALAFVGDADQFDESVEVAAATLARPLDSPAHSFVQDANLPDAAKAGAKAEQQDKKQEQEGGEEGGASRKLQGEAAGITLPGSEGDKPLDLEEARQERLRQLGLTGETLGRRYATCVQRQVAQQTVRRQMIMQGMKLADTRRLQLTPEARDYVDQGIIDEILKLNSLDVRLHQHAKELLTKRHAELTAAGKLLAVEDVPSRITLPSESGAASLPKKGGETEEL